MMIAAIKIFAVLLAFIISAAECTEDEFDDANSIIEVILKLNRKVNYALQELTLLQQPVLYPSHTKEHSAKRFYPRHGLAFDGFGYNRKSPSILYSTSSLNECIEKCAEHRLNYGKSWNGLSYTAKWGRTLLGSCFCNQNDSGIDDPNADQLHYKFL